MAVISGKVLPSNKHIVIALTSIYGVGRSRAALICNDVRIPHDKKVKDLVEAELERLRSSVGKHEVEGDLRRSVFSSIKRLMGIGCYRGIRHRLGLPVRGQNTQSNAKTARKRRASSRKDK